MEQWHVRDAAPSPARLREEIAFYEQKLATIQKPETSHDRGMALVYRAHIRHRRKLLAALRDGRPEAWAEYPEDD
jgi:hypothetical protein